MITDDRTNTVVYPETHVTSAPLLKRISWSAIFAGVALAMVVSVILNLLGTAIGSASIDPLQEGNPLDGLGKGTAIWVVASGIISLFVGGWVAGRLAQREGAMHGLLVWATTSLVTLYLVSSAVTGIVSSGLNLAGSGLSAVGSGISQVAPRLGDTVQDQLRKQGIDFNLDDIQGELETAMRQTGKPELNPDTVKQEAKATGQDAKNTAQRSAQNPQATDTQLSGLLDRIKAKGDKAWDAADREAFVNLIKARTGKTDAEANQMVDQAQQAYQQAYAKYQELKADAERKAREAADVAAKRVSQGAWLLLITLIISGLVAAGAGVLGRRTQPVTKVATTV
ncbi:MULTISPECIES: TIGR04086 family membrane protein [unclassified Pseudomonas]|uniref:TIGR04086 family membrane protein n=1 Tax=unclassified Pseudomonas TaxID=196821 RepID=UPI0025EF33AD|nr:MULTISPECIES: TIGR04086 family membrane protein [unclassified Pseudomonas]